MTQKLRTGVSYPDTVRALRYIKLDLENLANDGFDYIVHVLPERDLSFYTRGVLVDHSTMKEAVKETQETLRKATEELKETFKLPFGEE